MEPNCAAAGSIRHGSNGSAVDWAVQGVEGKQSTDPPPFELCLPALSRSTSTSSPTVGPREGERPRPSTRRHAPHLGSVVDWDKGRRTAPRLASGRPPRAPASLAEIPRGAIDGDPTQRKPELRGGGGRKHGRRPVWGGRRHGSPPVREGREAGGRSSEPAGGGAGEEASGG
jgi:hypothetical protein